MCAGLNEQWIFLCRVTGQADIALCPTSHVHTTVHDERKLNERFNLKAKDLNNKYLNKKVKSK